MVETRLFAATAYVQQRSEITQCREVAQFARLRIAHRVLDLSLSGVPRL